MSPKKHWADRLDDNELIRLLQKKKKYKEIPYFTDNKILNTIKNQDFINKERADFYRKQIFIYAFSTLSILIVVLISFIISKFYLANLNFNSCIVSNINGKAYYVKENKKKILNIKEKVVKNSTILTERKSSVELLLGEKSIINLGESSNLAFNKLTKKKNIENTLLYLKDGQSRFRPVLTPDSIFSVETNSAVIEVTGTDFSVDVSGDITEVYVQKGKINIRAKLIIKNLEKIKAYDKLLSEKLYDAVYSMISIRKDESVSISFLNVKKAEKDIKKIIDLIIYDLDKNKNNPDKITEIIKDSETKIIMIIAIKNKLLQKHNEDDTLIIQDDETDDSEEILEEKIIIKKLPSNPNIKLKEKNTMITADNRNIYISSNSNNGIFCINSETGKLIWKFSDPDLKDITSPAVSYKNDLLISSYNQVYIVTKSGYIKIKQEITNGTTFWAVPFIYDDKIFIPASSGLYYYKNTIIKEENFPETEGQVYITVIKSKVFCNDSEKKTISVYDLNAGETIWKSEKLKARSFNAPAVIGNNIIITDMIGNIYKFDYTAGENVIRSINIGTGNISQPDLYGNKIYFTANDGFLYSVKSSDLSFMKIDKVDDNPDSNKYLTKKVLVDNAELYFSSDTGKIYYYNIENDKSKFINIPGNNNPLISAPVKIADKIYFIDTASNIYTLVKE